MTRLNICMPVKMLKKLRAAAQAEGLSMSEFIRNALTAYLPK